MKNLIFLLLASFLTTQVSCNKDNPTPSCPTCIDCKEGDGISGPKCVWRQNSSDKLAATIPPIFYKDLLIITKKFFTKEPEVLQFFNKNTGEKLGEWSDYAADAPKGITGEGATYIYDNILVICTGTRLYGIDLTSFKTLWMSRSGTNGGISRVYGVADKTYHATYGATEEIMNIYEGSVKTGKYRKIRTYTCPDTTKLDLVYLTPFIQNNDTFALICTNNYFYNSNESRAYFTLLNVTKNEVIYEKDIHQDIIHKLLGGINAKPFIRNGIMHYSGLDATYAFELMTGKLLWRTPVPKHMTAAIVGGNPAIGDDFLYVSTEDGFIRCYDPNNGTELWKVVVPPSINPLTYHDGILFFRGASNNLKALDTKTRKIKWDYQLNANKKDQDRFVNTYIIPDPTTGRIYTTDFIDVYCFEKLQK
jgi:outer membrane protein assembly factor BamB